MNLITTCSDHVNLEVSNLAWENSESIYIQDPNGYEIELSKNCGGGI